MRGHNSSLFFLLGLFWPGVIWVYDSSLAIGPAEAFFVDVAGYIILVWALIKSCRLTEYRMLLSRYDPEAP